MTDTIACTIGVKQGDILGPILFTFFIAEVIITWRINYGGPLCLFRTKAYFILTSRSYRARGAEFPTHDSEYADDTAIHFESRNCLEAGVPKVISHFARFGMEVHVGNTQRSKADSKSEILFFLKPTTFYTDPDTYGSADLSNIDLRDGIFIPVVEQFGSVVSRNCTDVADVDARITKAGKVFGTLRKCLFTSAQVSYAVKSTIYTTPI